MWKQQRLRRKTAKSIERFVIIVFQVHKARHKETGRLAAAKICQLESDEVRFLIFLQQKLLFAFGWRMSFMPCLQELSDFAVEIDILHEFSHKNIIKLYDAFFHDTKLWVSHVVLYAFHHCHIRNITGGVQ